MYRHQVDEKTVSAHPLRSDTHSQESRERTKVVMLLTTTGSEIPGALSDGLCNAQISQWSPDVPKIDASQLSVAFSALGDSIFKPKPAIYTYA